MYISQRNQWLRDHHYRWRKNASGNWILLGPDGYPTTEQEARIAIGQVRNAPSPQQWAHSLMEKHPLILDTETSGLQNYHEVIELALVEIDGTVVLNTLIQSQEEIPTDATRIHGISTTMLSSAPTFPEVLASLMSYREREIIIYNAAFDIPLLAQTAERYHIAFPQFKSHCLMIQYLTSVAGTQKNENARESYRTLETACHDLGVAVGGHRALSDAQAAREVFCHLAANNEKR